MMRLKTETNQGEELCTLQTDPLLATPPTAYIVQETVRKETCVFLVKCLMYEESAEQNCFWRVRIKSRVRVDKENNC